MSDDAMCRCGARWVGYRIEHCPECCETFTGSQPGDSHRVGDHAVFAGPARRRCLTPDEMRAKGMVQNAAGYWQRGMAGRKVAPAPRKWPRSTADAAHTAEQAAEVPREGPESERPPESHRRHSEERVS